MNSIVVLFIALCILAVHGQFDGVNHEQTLLMDMFDMYGYNKDARPVGNYRRAVSVNHSLTLVRINRLENNYFEAYTWQSMKWMDERLRWLRVNHDGIDKVNIQDSKLWIPDIFLYNNAAEGSGKTYKTIRVVINHNGLVQYVPPTRVSTYCKNVETSEYPSKPGDKICELKFGSWTYTDDKLTLVVDQNGLILEDYEENPKFKIVSYSVTQNHESFGCCSGQYATIVYSLILRPVFAGPLGDEPETDDADSEAHLGGGQEKKDTTNTKETDEDDENENNDHVDDTLTETDIETNDKVEEDDLDGEIDEADDIEDGGDEINDIEEGEDETDVENGDGQPDIANDNNNVGDQTDDETVDDNIDDNGDDSPNDNGAETLGENGDDNGDDNHDGNGNDNIDGNVDNDEHPNDKNKDDENVDSNKEQTDLLDDEHRPLSV